MQLTLNNSARKHMQNGEKKRDDRVRELKAKKVDDKL